MAVSLAWDAETAPNIAGYRVYYGGSSGTYTNRSDVGNLTNAAVSGLASGVTYYFAATAYDTNGLESDYSAEVSYLVPNTNGPPSVVLSAPIAGSSYTAPAQIPLAATIIPNGHAINYVQYYQGGTLLGQTTASPYNLLWNNVPAGNYGLTARANYDDGSNVDSSSITVTVTNLPPTVALASPANGSNYSAPATISLAATVVENNHTIGQVRFFNGTNLLGAVAEPPFSFNWTNVNAGTFVLSAVLDYDSSSSVSSSPITVSVQGLPAPWQQTDVGTVGIAGSAGYDSTSATFLISGAGSNIGKNSDSFCFVWQPANGDCAITAQVTGMQTTVPSAQAGIMIRETLNPNSRFSGLFINPTDVIAFENRAKTGGERNTAQAAGEAVPYWLRLSRSSDVFNAYMSNDGATWVQVGTSRTMSMASSVYIGLCVSSHNNTNLNTSTFRNVTAVP
jgi:regulation of enolase protein 1 (concanavalin A-like superfamily)